MGHEPVCYQVTAFPLDMHPEAGSLDEQWIPFFAGLEKPIRVREFPDQIRGYLA